MAHFAELDANNVVLRVIVIDTKDNSDANGVEKEHIGAAFCERLFAGTWKQTSYNHNFRKRYAGIGFTYNGTNVLYEGSLMIGNTSKVSDMARNNAGGADEDFMSQVKVAKASPMVSSFDAVGRFTDNEIGRAHV